MTLFCFLLWLFPSTWAVAEPALTPHVTAELVSENRSLRDGQENWIGLRLEMEPHWHTYWRFPGDSGLPTRVKWTLPEGWKVSEPRWPLPTRIPLANLVNFGFENEALIGFGLEVPRGAKGSYVIEGEASWLVCKEECIPGKAKLTLNAFVENGESLPQPGPLADEFRKLKLAQPQALPTAPTLRLEAKRVGLEFPAANAFTGPVDFFPLAPSLVKGHEPPKVEKTKDTVTYWMEKTDPFSDDASVFPGQFIEGKGNDRRAYEVSLPTKSAPPAGTPAAALSMTPAEDAPTVWLAALFAFLGGLLLNLMPCVFPVLGIKVMALVSQGGNDQWHARRHGLVYGLGVIVSFWILTAVLLGLRSAGESVGWGFQLQQPAFVIALIALFSLLAANLAGFFEFGGRLMGAGSALAGRDGLSGSFFTGILAVVVATPCTAPFMGTAIGVVLSQPAWAVLLVFSCLGLGLAAPFVFLCYQPRLVRALPRPGLWMQKLKEFFAFPLVATVLWLFWVLGLQVGVGGLVKAGVGLLLMFSAIWVKHSFRSLFGKAGALLLLLAALLAAWGALKERAAAKVEADGAWKTFSEAAVEEARKAGPVFVDFTAAWCLTCQVNKVAVLDREGMQAFFREKGITLFLADWTNSDPEITKALEKNGRIGVPLYLVYIPGRDRPEVLPQVLTEDLVKKAFP